MTSDALSLIRSVFGGSNYALPDESVEACLDGQVISHAGLFWRTIDTEHGPCPIGGIGLVCTAAGWRRGGLATALMEAARRRSSQHGRPCMALFAGDGSLYEDLGYIKAAGHDHLYTYGLAHTVVTDTRGLW